MADAIRSAFSISRSGSRVSRKSSSEALLNSPSLPDHEAPFVACLVNLSIDRLYGLPASIPESSDVHVVVRVLGESRTVYTSHRLELTGEELEEVQVGDKVSIVVDDIGKTLLAEVIIKNKWRKDDVLDKGTLELAQCKLFKCQPISFPLGSGIAISSSIQIQPLTLPQKEEFVRRWGGGSKVDHARTSLRGTPSDSSIINIVLIKGFSIGDPSDPPDALCKFKLGSERYKSRAVVKSCDPEWGEHFEMKLPKGTDLLEIQVVCRRTRLVLSNGQVNLSGLPRDEAVRQEVPLLPCSSLSIIVSVPSSSHSNSVLPNIAPAYDNSFSLCNTFKKMKEVGELVVKVIRAENVEAMDLGGKSDPFAILRLGNLRVRTHTHYATLNPEWNRLFVLPVEDVHSWMDISLFDEDNTGKADFLGRITIPLLAISGWERRWFILKDRKMNRPTRGRVLIEMRLQYNLVRAVIRTFAPREKEYQVTAAKFKPSVLKSSVAEIRRFGSAFTPLLQGMDSIITWKRPTASIIAIIMWVCFILTVEVYHLPLLLLAVILHISYRHSQHEDIPLPSPENPPPTNNKEGEGSSSILAISDTLVEVQETLLFITLLLQRIRNVSTMEWPWLTRLLLFVLCLVTVLLYFIPIRYLLLAFGLNKLTKRLRKPPNFVDNNELVDFLSRVPSDRQLKEWQEPRTEGIGGTTPS